MIRGTMLNVFRPRTRSILACLLLTGSPCVRAQTGDPAQSLSGDSISVMADFASEDRGSRALRVEGNVQVTGADWEFAADSALLTGTLDDAEQLDASGSPARIFFRNADDADGISEVEGLARDISYRRHDDILRLKGGASLRRDANTLTSEDIEYRRSGDLFKAGGAGGVRLTITPGQRRSATDAPQR